MHCCAGRSCTVFLSLAHDRDSLLLYKGKRFATALFWLGSDCEPRIISIKVALQTRAFGDVVISIDKETPSHVACDKRLSKGVDQAYRLMFRPLSNLSFYSSYCFSRHFRLPS